MDNYEISYCDRLPILEMFNESRVEREFGRFSYFSGIDKLLKMNEKLEKVESQFAGIMPLNQ